MFPGELGQGKDVLASLSNELERQADIYKGLGVNKDDIMKLLAPRPEGLPEELRIPVVTLGTSVDLKRQADFAGIETSYDLSRGYDTARGITFEQPHLIWMQDGSKYLGKNVKWVRGHQGKNERPATQYDGVAFITVNPDFRDLLRKHAIDLPGTAVESGHAPYLVGWDGRPRLNRHFVNDAFPSFGSASCGS